MQSFILRDATPADLPQLVALEAASFDADRLSPRSFRRLIGGATAACRVAMRGGNIAGYHLVLFRAGTPAARLYSIAVARQHRGEGLAGRLMADVEAVAGKRGRRRLCLEVRLDNAPAIALYERLGYRPVGRRLAYYADGADALCFEKTLPGGSGRGAPPRERRRRVSGKPAPRQKARRGGGIRASMDLTGTRSR